MRGKEREGGRRESEREGGGERVRGRKREGEERVRGREWGARGRKGEGGVTISNCRVGGVNWVTFHPRTN